MGGRKDVCGAGRGTSFEAKKWLSLDICGLIGVTLSFSVHIFAFGVIVYYVVADSLIANGIFLLFYFPAFLLALLSLYMAWTSDPGSVPMGARPLVTVRRASAASLAGASSSGNRTRALRRCPKCGDNFKPGRAHHDSVTGRCIVKFDHFCPWVGNAVGAMNHKFFVLFVGYTMTSCLCSLLLIGIRTIYCGSPSPLFNEKESDLLECKGWNESYLGLALLIVSLVFFLFTSIMFFDQIEAIKTNVSKIARMQMSVGRGGTELARVTDEFNEMFGGESNQIAWHWFLPLAVAFPNGMKKVVLGYEWDETFDAVPYQDPADRDVESGSIHSVSSNRSSRIELTTVPPTNGTQAGTEGDQFADEMSTSSDRPNLVNRKNSREDFGKDDPLRTPGGTMS
mmetsp:Transcript_10715/g.22264  ORF Transcript_10715/g.22264 Transcript_10715/m.22264 type:complete len:396 (+) Transcript_10715:109-1296(+)